MMFADLTAGIVLSLFGMAMIYIGSLGTNIEMKHKAIEQVKKSRG